MYNMMQYYGSGYGWAFPFLSIGLLSILLLWSFFWKGLALWHAARRKEGWWFVILLAVNTAGILEIIYLFAVAKVPTKDLFTK